MNLILSFVLASMVFSCSTKQNTPSVEPVENLLRIKEGTYDSLNTAELEKLDVLLDGLDLNLSKDQGTFREMQKALYVSNEWERFFARSLVYRHKFYKKDSDPSPLVLEMLALLRFCHVDVVSSLMEKYKGAIPQSDLEMLGNILSLLKKYFRPPQTKLYDSQKENLLYWPQAKKAYSRLSQLRLKLNYLCALK